MGQGIMRQELPFAVDSDSAGRPGKAGTWHHNAAERRQRYESRSTVVIARSLLHTELEAPRKTMLSAADAHPDAPTWRVRRPPVEAARLEEETRRRRAIEDAAPLPVLVQDRWLPLLGVILVACAITLVAWSMLRLWPTDFTPVVEALTATPTLLGAPAAK